MPTCVERRVLAPGEAVLSVERGRPPVDTDAVIPQAENAGAILRVADGRDFHEAIGFGRIALFDPNRQGHNA